MLNSPLVGEKIGNQPVEQIVQIPSENQVGIPGLNRLRELLTIPGLALAQAGSTFARAYDAFIGDELPHDEIRILKDDILSEQYLHTSEDD